MKIKIFYNEVRRYKKMEHKTKPNIKRYRAELIKYIKECKSEKNLCWLYLSMQCCNDYKPKTTSA